MESPPITPRPELSNVFMAGGLFDWLPWKKDKRKKEDKKDKRIKEDKSA